ncbi:MAG: glycine--tRNA ligase subunit beta, partial [Pseudohongiellaceae bacterium]
MTSKDFLVEVGTEELPPKALRLLSSAFQSQVVAGLNSAGLSYVEIKAFATPRRLALLVKGLLTSQPDQSIEKFGPAVKAAFDVAGNPSPAASGFARSCGVTVDALQKAVLDGVEKLVYRHLQSGKESKLLLPSIINAALMALPVPKRMRWGSSRIEFVRPVHWVVMLLGSDVVEAEILGIRAGRETRGHRFHHPDNISLKQAADYQLALFKSGSVIADFDERKETIRKLVLEEGIRLMAKVNIDEALLDEVTSLVEWPVALTGSFDMHFLNLPAEALVSSMKAHQKCFTLTDESGKLLALFITVSNLRSRDPAQVIAGNEKVIRPRLADAKFFFDTDQKQRLETRLDALKGIVFQQQLGSVYDKSQRVAALATRVADQLGADKDTCIRAALLSKCDLVTNMVGEFGELQGIMGYYYALADGEKPDVALAINEHYMPRYAGDQLPSSLTGSVVAVADKLDMIVGLFAIGQPPTGSKDPFALRRAAIGVLRILVEKQFDLDLRDMIASAMRGYEFLKPDQEISAQVLDFMLERFRAWYQDEGISSEVFQAVLALRPANPVDFHSRVLAVHHFSMLPQAQALSSANKRVSNILAKLDQPLTQKSVTLEMLTVAAEKQLAKALEERAPAVTLLFSQRRYKEGLQQLAELKDPIDKFFDDVLVMDKDELVRNNR